MTEERRDYKWWDKVDNKAPLEQGDVIENYPILVPPLAILDREEGEEVKAKLRLYNVVVLSQSCDIQQCKIDMALICPVTTLSDFVSNKPEFFPIADKEKMQTQLQKLKDDHIIGACLLEKCLLPGIRTHPLVVEFKNAQSTPLQFLQEFVKKNQDYRLRLLPPYKERLSQSFARFFMRVGLPIDINVKKMYKEISSATNVEEKSQKQT